MSNKKNIEDIFPLSPVQQGILFHSILDPDRSVYITQVCLTLSGDINPNSIKQAWQEIVDRHQVLRAAFRWEKKAKTFQVIYKQVQLPWREEDWQEYSLSEQDIKLQEYLKADKKQGFALKRAPLIRISLIRLAPTTYKLVWTQHHLILDGWSSSLILKEFFAIYNGFQCHAPIPYSQYIAWLNRQDVEAATKYWQNKLDGFDESTSLKLYGQQLNNKIHSSQEIKLSVALTDRLKHLSTQNSLTLNTILQGAFAILLSRYTNCQDIVYGTTTSGRPATFSSIETMVGLFINTLPMRVKLSDTELLLPWLENLQQQQIENLNYEYTPLTTIKELSNIPQGVPLFENIFVFENYPVDTESLANSQKLSIESIEIDEINNFPFTCLVKLARSSDEENRRTTEHTSSPESFVKVSSKISITIQYQSDFFSSNTINKILESFEYLLIQIVDNPRQSLGRLSILTPPEKELIESWQQTQADYPLDQTIPELFNQQVTKTPNATALIFEEQEYTYQELNARADALANYLINLGVKPETPVGIYLERSEKIAIAILATVKAGGVYVPLEPNYPLNRINFIIQDTQLSILLTQTIYRNKLSNSNLTVINLDSPFASYTPPAPSTPLHPENGAYIIYTSGSTGKPKGVINTHSALVNRLLWMQDSYQLKPKDRVLQKTPFSFDVSVWEFFWTWLNGACLVIAKPEGHKDSKYLSQLINETRISVLHFVPSMLDVFLEESNVSNCQSIEKVICSGETLSVSTKNKFFTKLNAELHNLYGPTEAAIDVTAYQCHDDKNNIIPIGKGISNTQIYILNSQQQINPVGVSGELHIAGRGLSRGYLNRPELTAEKFIPNPFSANSSSCTSAASLLYKTGDLACYLPNGNIQFLGRSDRNIKVRGFRIELEEIEAILNKYPSVKQSTVLIREDWGVHSQIVAYLIHKPNVVPEKDLDVIRSIIIDYLKQELPYYMIPDALVFLAELPLNPNGKLDYKSLPQSQIKTAFIAPRNDLEQKIATIWQEVLQLEKVSVNDNFFELGGNSLSATRVNSKLAEALSIEIPLRTMFEKPTISTIAQRIQLIEISATNQNLNLISNSIKRQEIEI
ncbi:MAG: amino acid adenylation domain-containing protein [Cyanobacteria bacterium P01_G01_bin.39]